MTRDQFNEYVNITDGINTEAGTIETEAMELTQEAERYAVQAQQSADKAAATNADAARIEGRLDNLEGWFGEALANQREAIDTRAAGVLTAATNMVEALRGETVRMVGALREGEVARLGAAVDRARDPVSGRRMPVDDVTASLFRLHRDEAIKAREYAALGLTATVYAGYGLSALGYDTAAKALLV